MDDVTCRVETPEQDPDRVVILIHGIKSKAEGMIKIRERLFQRTDHPETVVRIFNYRRFPAVIAGFPVISYFKNVRDTYRDYLAHYIGKLMCQFPNSELDVVAHSFGTFLISEALKNHPTISVDRMILLGSVVDTDFQWSSFIRAGRVDYVCNFVGESDWVQYLSGLTFVGMGTSGSYGFKTEIPGAVENVYPDPTWNHTSYSKKDNISRILDKLD
jgi:pimeloyl-ACP methyl ester carboxylesterase